MTTPLQDDLLYGLEERPAPLAAFCAALQHVLAKASSASSRHR
ncbi:hypothetical protein Q3H58_001828 [Pseudomonas psychrotolerans]|nr:hypothetical protein [Pseudomonas psychrotolerans]